LPDLVGPLRLDQRQFPAGQGAELLPGDQFAAHGPPELFDDARLAVNTLSFPASTLARGNAEAMAIMIVFITKLRLKLTK
jgi:hypothetical protein